MDVDHLAAEDSDEGGLTGECQQVIPGCSCRQFTCNIFPAHCPNAQIMCRLFVDEDKAAAGHRLLEVAPPFHMAAGSEQEEEDLVETSKPSGRPGPTQSSGEGAHHLCSCQTIAEALVEARLAGNLQSRIVRLVAKAGVPQGLAREVPLPTSHCGDQRPQMQGPTGGPSLEDLKRLSERHLTSSDECLCALQSKETRSAPCHWGISGASRAGRLHWAALL